MIFWVQKPPNHFQALKPRVFTTCISGVVQRFFEGQYAGLKANQTCCWLKQKSYYAVVLTCWHDCNILCVCRNMLIDKYGSLHAASVYKQTGAHCRTNMHACIVPPAMHKPINAVSEAAYIPTSCTSTQMSEWCIASLPMTHDEPLQNPEKFVTVCHQSLVRLRYTMVCCRNSVAKLLCCGVSTTQDREQ